MSDTNAQEPTMEEILASIRRIISEDDAPQAKAPSQPAPPAPMEAALPPGPSPTPPAPPAPAFAPPPAAAEAEDDVLDLTEPLSPEPEHSYVHEPVPAYRPPLYEPLGDLDVSAPSRAPEAPAAYAPHEPLVSAPAAGVAASHFGQLTRSIAAPADGRTLEDVVVAVLRPMLKDWLDRYLAQIVESKVQAEVERISRSNPH